jgi:glucosyl-3-phosphoglycerate synthase
MADFYQHRFVTTLHHLGDNNIEALEASIEKQAEKRPVSLVMPALYSEVEQPALPIILGELSKVRYVNEIIFSMNRMNADQFKYARDFIFSRLPEEQKKVIIWNDGPRFLDIYKKLEEACLTAYVPGKGYNVWMAMGYILAQGDSRIVACHDSDILSYHREMLLRICFPTVHSDLAYEYCKSYYARTADKLYGRVTRLFVGPLLRALMKVLGDNRLLAYLDDFRYPLSGEFSFTTDIAGAVRVPGDWGLEIGSLVEIWRNTTYRRVCQVDLGHTFEHKHQDLGYNPDEVAQEEPLPKTGLMKMAQEIALSLFYNMVSEGYSIGKTGMQSIQYTYERIAKETIKRYNDDSIINGLAYQRHEEAAAVEAYSHALKSAGEIFLAGDYHAPQIPNWNRVNSALPDLGDQIKEAVAADLKEVEG